MPELPEVETVRRSLIDLVLNKNIKSIEVYYESMLKNTKKDELTELIVNQTFKDIKRVGKFLVFILDDYILLSHLRMEGKYFLRGDEPKEKHEHLIFRLDNNESLRYNDTRKFGVLYLFKTTDLEAVKKLEPLNRLGIEPISGDLTINFLKDKFRNNNQVLKQALLDQSIISGLGNIYADEVCFMAKLNPLVKVRDLNDEMIERIIDASTKVLEKAINLGGTTIKSFVSSHNATGLFQNELLVHTKTICPTCKDNIKKIKVGGRTTYYCKNCQRRNVLIGITGSIACGKTESLNILKKKYNTFKYLDCDEITHELLDLKEVRSLLKDKFNSYYNDIDIYSLSNIELRKKLASVVFTNLSFKKYLESIIHPRVKEIIKQEKDKHEVTIVEVPLLFESHMENMFDKIICIYSSKEVQVERLIKRGLTIEEIIKRISTQMDINLKIKKSSYSILNDYSISNLEDELTNVINDIKVEFNL